MVDERRLKEMRKRLLVRRRWAYLRYLNLREAFLKAENVLSVLAVGCGQGYTELALALEFPEVHFHLTDLVPTYEKAKELVGRWKVRNVTFGVRDILRPEPGRYDLVTAIDVLDHIEHDRWAAAELRAATNEFVFVLVPFAERSSTNGLTSSATQVEGGRAFRQGYDADQLRDLFPSVVEMRGCFWTRSGLPWRQRLESLSDEEVIAAQDELERSATADHRLAVPQRRSQACGIWVLSNP